MLKIFLITVIGICSAVRLQPTTDSKPQSEFTDFTTKSITGTLKKKNWPSSCSGDCDIFHEGDIQPLEIEASTGGLHLTQNENVNTKEEVSSQDDALVQASIDVENIAKEQMYKANETIFFVFLGVMWVLGVCSNVGVVLWTTGLLLGGIFILNHERSLSLLSLTYLVFCLIVVSIIMGWIGNVPNPTNKYMK